MKNNEWFEKLSLKEKFHFIAFDCEGRMCQACPWIESKNGEFVRCIKRDIMRQIESKLEN